LEILKRAKEFQSGEGVSAFESEANVREEVNRRTYKAGYTNKDGTPIRRDTGAGKGDVPCPCNYRKYSETCNRIFGEKKLNIWPRDKNGRLIDD
jgi:hypothetical protein